MVIFRRKTSTFYRIFVPFSYYFYIQKHAKTTIFLYKNFLLFKRNYDYFYTIFTKFNQYFSRILAVF